MTFSSLLSRMTMLVQYFYLFLCVSTIIESLSVLPLIQEMLTIAWCLVLTVTCFCLRVDRTFLLSPNIFKSGLKFTWLFIQVFHHHFAQFHTFLTHQSIRWSLNTFVKTSFLLNYLLQFGQPWTFMIWRYKNWCFREWSRTFWFSAFTHILYPLYWSIF